MSALAGKPVVRKTSSPHLLARRVRAVGEAWAAGDAEAVRGELRELAAEAALLARADPLPIGGVAKRQVIAAERRSTGSSTT